MLLVHVCQGFVPYSTLVPANCSIDLSLFSYKRFYSDHTMHFPVKNLVLPNTFPTIRIVAASIKNAAINLDENTVSSITHKSFYCMKRQSVFR
jgi:hypothetical protein